MLLLDSREGRAVEGREGAVAVEDGGSSSCGCGGGSDSRLAAVRVGGSSRMAILYRDSRIHGGRGLADVYRDRRFHGRLHRNVEEGWMREKASRTRELVETAVFTEVVSGCGSGLDRSENESDKGRTEEGDLEVTWQRGRTYYMHYTLRTQNFVVAMVVS